MQFDLTPEQALTLCKAAHLVLETLLVSEAEQKAISDAQQAVYRELRVAELLMLKNVPDQVEGSSVTTSSKPKRARQTKKEKPGRGQRVEKNQHYQTDAQKHIHADEEKRARQAEEEHPCEDQGLIDFLLRALNDRGSLYGSPENIIKKLNKYNIRDVRFIEPLIAHLKDKEWGSRWNTMHALARFGAPAIQPLIAALKDENQDIQRRAAWTLGYIGTPAVQPLISLLKSKNQAVRQWATEALRRIGTPEALAALNPTSKAR